MLHKETIIIICRRVDESDEDGRPRSVELDARCAQPCQLTGVDDANFAGYRRVSSALTRSNLFRRRYEMDAEKFASIFHPSGSVTKVADDGNLGVTPIASWLAAVRNMKAPKQQGFEREDQILAIDVESDLALLKLKLRIPPRSFTDLLSCLKVNGNWKIVQKVMTSKA